VFQFKNLNTINLEIKIDKRFVDNNIKKIEKEKDLY